VRNGSGGSYRRDAATLPFSFPNCVAASSARFFSFPLPRERTFRSRRHDQAPFLSSLCRSAVAPFMFTCPAAVVSSVDFPCFRMAMDVFLSADRRPPFFSFAYVAYSPSGTAPLLGLKVRKLFFFLPARATILFLSAMWSRHPFGAGFVKAFLQFRLE